MYVTCACMLWVEVYVRVVNYSIIVLICVITVLGCVAEVQSCMSTNSSLRIVGVLPT